MDDKRGRRYIVLKMEKAGMRRAPNCTLKIENVKVMHPVNR